MQKNNKKLFGNTNLIVPTIAFFLFISVIAYYSVNEFIIVNIKNTARASAQDTIAKLKLVRSYYTTNILKKVIGIDGIKGDVEHKNIPKTIPLPATMVHDLGKLFSESGFPVKLYSPYPFPNRADRKLDGFGKKAWQAVQKNPQQAYLELEWQNSEPVIRVAIADIFLNQVCVNCHNTRADTPKDDWELNDIRGLMEVSIPMKQQIEKAQWQLYSMVYSAIFAMFFVVLFLLSNIKNRNKIQLGLNTIINLSNQSFANQNIESQINLFSQQLAQLIPIKGLVRLFQCEKDGNNKDVFIENMSDEKQHQASKSLFPLLSAAKEKSTTISEKKKSVLYLHDTTSEGLFIYFESKKNLNKLDKHLLDIYVQSLEAMNDREKQSQFNESLQTAKNIQMSMLPTNFSEFSSQYHLDLYAYLCPAKEIGGDLYDFFEIDKNRIALVLGDVSGKGVPAALFMTMTKLFIRSMTKQTSLPAEILSQVNDELCHDNHESMFVTLFMAIYDRKQQQLTYTNAGHNPPYLICDNKVQGFEISTSLPLGIFEQTKYENKMLNMPDDSALFIYSDGINEAMNYQFKEYGISRLEEKLALNIDLDAKACTEDLVADIKQFTHGVEQSDDMAILYIIPNKSKSILS